MNNGQNLLFENQIGPSLVVEEWFTTVEAAAFLKVSPNRLRNLVSMGKMPYYKLEGSNRYLKADLMGILLATRKGPTNGSKKEL